MTSIADYMARAIGSKFLRFALVGTTGFLVDAAVLGVGLRVLLLDPYSARALSFVCAATFTWAANRRFTFMEEAATRGRAGEWARFLAVNSIGGLINYATYAALVALAPQPLSNPFVALGIGSLAGLSLNYFGSKQFVFRGGRGP